MNTISKSHLKAHMLRVFREIERSGEEMIVTDNSRPVLKIVPIKNTQSVDTLFDNVRGQVVYSRNLNGPVQQPS